MGPRIRLTSVLVLALAGCPTAKPLAPEGPPAGRRYSDYLHGGETPASRPVDTDDRQSMTYHFLDVGQGTAILLEFPCGVILVDTGGESHEAFDSRQELFAYLDAFFTGRPDLDRTLDGLIITHPHIDHDRWVLDVLEGYRVRNVVDNGGESDETGGREQKAMHEWLRAHPEVQHRDVLAEDVLGRNGLTDERIDPVGACEASDVDPVVRALWGRVTYGTSTYGENPNLHSIVLRVDFGKSSALLTADLETHGIARMSAKADPGLLDVDLYQVGHHGSRNATVGYLMKSMTPKIAVIPVGAWERDLDWTARAYGHPHKQAYDLLVDPRHGVSWARPAPKQVRIGLKGSWKGKKSEWEQVVVTRAVYATGWDGTIRVRANASGWLDVETEK